MGFFWEMPEHIVNVTFIKIIHDQKYGSLDWNIG